MGRSNSTRWQTFPMQAASSRAEAAGFSPIPEILKLLRHFKPATSISRASMASGVFIRASSQSLAGRGIRWIFTAPLGQLYSARPDWLVHECGKAAYVAGFGEIEWAGCTILRHGAVNGMHSIEK